MPVDPLSVFRRPCPAAASADTRPAAPDFSLLLALTVLVTAFFAAAHALNGHPLPAMANAGTAALAAFALFWARHPRHARVAVHVVAATLVAVLAWQTVIQGPELPAAAWWLSVLPFTLAAAGLYAMAFSTVALVAGIVAALHGGVTPDSLGLSAAAPVPPWRQLAAVIGSELLAVAVIAHSIHQRCVTARALDRARDTAVEAAAAKSRLLATMSHEVRTPLNGVIGTAQLLKHEGLDAARRAQLLDLQEHSAKALLGRLNDILDWSKLEAGKLVLEARPLSPRRIAAEVNELFAMQAHAKGIELTWSCNPDVPRTAVGDAMRLRQILDNLVGNAVKFTSSGGVHLHLALEPAAPHAAASSQRALRIEVADSGIGIDPHRLEGLFAPFTQADASVARRYGGTGLGLAICRDLAHTMGGRIEVASVRGCGSTFTLIVPLVMRPGRRAAGASPRIDVMLVSSSPGVQRHLRTVLHDLRVEPVVLGELPAAAPACRLLLVDAPLLAKVPQPRIWLRAQLDAGVQVAVITPLGADRHVDLPDGVLRLYKPVRRRALKAVLAVVDAADTAPAPLAGPREFLPSVPAGGPHVLVAEDDAVNQVVVQAMLGQLGATSVIAVNGREALQCLATEAFDLVLMDMQMPELDGLAATRTWRAHEAAAGARRTPIVAMTAHAAAADAQAGRAAGMDDHLVKPFDMPELRALLQRVGRQRRPLSDVRLAPRPGPRQGGLSS